MNQIPYREDASVVLNARLGQSQVLEQELHRLSGNVVLRLILRALLAAVSREESQAARRLAGPATRAKAPAGAARATAGAGVGVRDAEQAFVGRVAERAGRASAAARGHRVVRHLELLVVGNDAIAQLAVLLPHATQSGLGVIDILHIVTIQRQERGLSMSEGEMIVQYLFQPSRRQIGDMRKGIHQRIQIPNCQSNRIGIRNQQTYTLKLECLP